MGGEFRYPGLPLSRENTGPSLTPAAGSFVMPGRARHPEQQAVTLAALDAGAPGMTGEAVSALTFPLLAKTLRPEPNRENTA